MRKSCLLLITSLFIFCSVSAFAKTQLTEDEIATEALHILQQLSLKEKIGQKLMLDFTYWCDSKPQGNQPCIQDFTQINPTVKQILSKNHIGGIILFSNNLKDIPQIVVLTDELQKAMHETNRLPLLIGADQEGGIVTRLPRDVSVSFPGNMAIAAAYLGNSATQYSVAVGKTIARDLKAVGVNIDFAPDVDVNLNPLNPVIHVRSFSDDPELVAKLGLDLSQGIQDEGIAATLKHFPGHGDTVTDSHRGLPVVDHDLDQAWKIDLYPFKYIIDKSSPDLIMTAHIQFPALDDSLIFASKAGKEITAPATLSRKIQHDLLRTQLGYQGIIITDALDMGAIVQNFDSTEATIKAFQADDDIALMPLIISQPQDAENVAAMISKIEAAVLDGKISLDELNQSVLRILKLKIKLGLLQPDPTPLSEKITEAEKILADKEQYELESALTNDAVTLVQNNNNLVPIKPLPNTRIHILTPWLEQAAGLVLEISKLQEAHFLPPNLELSFAMMSDTDLAREQQAINEADILIVGNMAIHSSPLSSFRLSTALPLPEGSLVFLELPMGDSIKNSNKIFNLRTELAYDQFAFQALQYAKKQHKKTIYLSLLTPYDLPNYAGVSDAMLAGYDPYGYLKNQTQGFYRGPSMQALVRVIFGFSHAGAKLPINIPDPAKPSELVYLRGYGLTS